MSRLARVTCLVAVLTLAFVVIGSNAAGAEPAPTGDAAARHGSPPADGPTLTPLGTTARGGAAAWLVALAMATLLVGRTGGDRFRALPLVLPRCASARRWASSRAPPLDS